jgi:hypothetical protein
VGYLKEKAKKGSSKGYENLTEYLMENKGYN